MHCPGIEPGAAAWKAAMLPLHQQCFSMAAGFEPARGNPNGLAVHRLNHSAKPSELSMTLSFNTRCGARTHGHQIKSLALYH